MNWRGPEKSEQKAFGGRAPAYSASVRTSVKTHERGDASNVSIMLYRTCTKKFIHILYLALSNSFCKEERERVRER